MVTDGKQTYHDDHFEVYKNIESLCCALGTNVGKLCFKNKQTNLEKKRSGL